VPCMAGRPGTLRWCGGGLAGCWRLARLWVFTQLLTGQAEQRPTPFLLRTLFVAALLPAHPLLRGRPPVAAGC